ncbi:MAG: response regulator transcription factor [Gammaproteobacteria bacterium]|nr:response regulator transcription factor [Gammaproteobacteria bacterium]NIR90060.1 response regulator transcription factor [Gammaproteobacteria bacterium]NIU03264.1 response regulator transcription factor [Gammaproteobacteria bacterium]NIV50758.1 response regulator [Gammaproteobacteria bacterium]NIV75344.1 response regulator [Gammaproteobacteria bacterium]
MEPAPRVRLFVADERRLCRESLGQALASEGTIDLVGEAANWRQTIDMARDLRPDVALVSALLPGMPWIDGVEHLGTETPSTKTILGCSSDEALIVEALKAGARGYLREDTSIPDCVKAIRAVHAGELWIERRIMAKCLDKSAVPTPIRAQLATDEALTRREEETLGLVGRGLSNKHIARMLCISEKTVKSHLNNIFRKLGFQRRSQAIVYALQYGLHEATKDSTRGRAGNARSADAPRDTYAQMRTYKRLRPMSQNNSG